MTIGLTSARVLARLASMRTAIVLLCLVAAGHVAGTLILQNPPEHVAVAKYGMPWHHVFSALGLYDAPRAWWLLVLQGVLALSVMACLWHQLPGRLRQKITLRTVGYASLHIGILGLVLAGLLDGVFGWKGQLNLRMGETDHIVLQPHRGAFIPHTLPFAVTATQFTIQRHSSGAPKAFETQLMLSESVGSISQTTTHTLSVNQPITHGAYRVYQADYGDAGSSVTLAFGDTAPETHRVYDTFTHENYRYELLDAPTHVQFFGEGAGQAVTLKVAPPTAAPLLVQLHETMPTVVGVATNPQAETPEWVPVPRGVFPHPLPQLHSVEKAYYTGLLVAYSPSPWVFWLAAILILLGVFCLAKRPFKH